MSESIRPAILAGQACREQIENETDLEARAAWERARIRLRIIATLMRDSPEWQETEAAKRRALQEVGDAIRAELASARDALEARHLGRPEGLEGWEHLARVIEMPDERLRTGDYAINDVHKHALAWVDRQIAKARLAAEAARPNRMQITEVSGASQAVAGLLSLFSNGVADERITAAGCVLLKPGLTVNEKLEQIDALMRIPAAASAQVLAKLLRVTASAVKKTAWWARHRKGEKQVEIGRRQERLRERGKRHEQPNSEGE